MLDAFNEDRCDQGAVRRAAVADCGLQGRARGAQHDADAGAAAEREAGVGGKSLQEVEEKADKAHTRLDEVTDRLAKTATRDHGARGHRRAHQGAGRCGRRRPRRSIASDRARRRAAEAQAGAAEPLVAGAADARQPRHAQEGPGRARRAARAAAPGAGRDQDVARADRGAEGGIRSAPLASRASSRRNTRKLKDMSRETHDEANATVELVKDVEKRLGPLAQLQEMSKTTEERMASLNALAEHVTQKIKALENQKHTVEHAVVEANRLNEMVWAMEVQINKLNEGSRQAARTEELIDRVEKLSREVAGAARRRHEGRATRSRSTSAKLEKDRGSLTDFVRTYTDRARGRAQGVRRVRFSASRRCRRRSAKRRRGWRRSPRAIGWRRRWASASISCRSRCRRSTPAPTICRRSRRRSTACRNRSHRWTSSPSGPPGSTTT